MIKSFFSFILIILLFLSSFSGVVYRLQNPDFVLDQAREINFYGRVVDNATSLIPESQFKSFDLSNSDVSDIVKAAVDSEQFYGFLSAALKAYLPWLAVKTNNFNFSYNLSPVKTKFQTTTAAKVKAKYDNLAICTANQLRTWGFDDGLPACQLPAGTLQSKSIDNQINQSVSQLTKGWPDQITTSSPSSGLMIAREKIALVFRGIYATWIITGALLALFLILYRSKGLVNLAISFLVVGLLEIGFSIIGWDWILRTLSDFIAGLTDTKTLVPLIIDLIAVILATMRTTYGNISVAFLGTGVGLLVLGIIYKFRTPKILDITK